MLQNILIDLDDTLLDTNMDTFLPNYFNALGEKLKEFMHPEELIRLVLDSTHRMITDSDPKRTNEQVFAENFFPGIPFPEKQITDTILDFYEFDFPKLKHFVKPLPGIRNLVNSLLTRDLKVVIATNPLFPARAIEHRLEWAGLAGLDFDLVTTYENSHFCKPNPFYYKEILEKLDALPNESIMIGDDEDNDIIPAAKAGLSTFRIGEGKTSADARGSFDEAVSQILSGVFN